MPIGGNLGNHVNLGVPQLCTGITSGGQLFDHGLPDTPAAVLFLCQTKVGAAVAATPSYDKAASNSTQMKLYTSAAGTSDWYVIPLSGGTIEAR